MKRRKFAEEMRAGLFALQRFAWACVTSLHVILSEADADKIRRYVHSLDRAALFFLIFAGHTGLSQADSETEELVDEELQCAAILCFSLFSTSPSSRAPLSGSAGRGQIVWLSNFTLGLAKRRRFAEEGHKTV